jgi:hypothetical protein
MFTMQKRQRQREIGQDKMFVMEALRGMVRAGLAVWKNQSSCERELHLLSGEIFLLDEEGIRRVR